MAVSGSITLQPRTSRPPTRNDDALTLAEYCASRNRIVETALDQWLPQSQQSGNRLAQAMRYAVFSGGKRLRPVLTLMACAAAGSDESVALAPACAVELVHCYSLVHDDLPAMDDDDLRRGRPTVHVAFDQPTAILAGDALLTLAFEVIAEHGPEEILAARCCRELARAAGALGMVGGQADDMLGSSGASTAMEQLDRLHSIHARKTGELILAAVRLGAISARSNSQVHRALDNYGRCVGLAFQIMDDLLDVLGDEATTGKRVRKDEDRGKLTFPRLLGMNEARQRALSLVDDACHALEPLGSSAERLCQLARFVVERNH